ncbi:complex I subunit 4 family protein [Aeoliella mucimassa]|uniref:NADH-quinone oxidoreductase subunit M n=1 Tax=Aeoliella mucimassa TaxID=2527972 RepID=A0A518ARY9_9BACT|nr:NADH-quinone oxidoreductase subunit M [Aeoliella mucimassa]QDU57476.1 NADH-quinone oxidoreductase subunit M [Aeoliella mucimassa]
MNLDNPAIFLSLLVFLPALAAAAIACFAPNDNPEVIKKATFWTTVVTFLLSIGMLFGWPGIQFQAGVDSMQHLFSVDWIPSFNIYFALGIDGISLPLVLLTTFISMLAMGASWPIEKHVKAYCVLFLLLETGMIGVFLALDFFLFYVLWEVMLLPMYFLIGVWGGPRREYAAIKFFLFTLFGSVLMLIAILMLYFSSDVRDLPTAKLQEFRFSPAQIEAIDEATTPQHTFSIMALQELGQTTDQFKGKLAGMTYEWWAFLLLLIGFLIKVPSVPVHTWLPDAHVEAPTPISMILAGVLLKMGGYGIIRIAYPICPEAAYDLAWLVCSLGVVSMVYGAFAALAQTDFKRLVAYSSVSHMGYVVLGLGVWSAMSPDYNADYWRWGMNGAMFQMIAHGVSSAGMFFMVGVLYDRVHHRDLNKFGGIFGRMPVYSGLAVGIFFAGLGLPGLCGFVGEVMVVLSTWKYCIVLAVIAASVVILTAGYILWTLQRVYLGADYNGPHPEALTPLTSREFRIAAPLLALAILFGVYPRVVLDYMEPSVSRTVEQLAPMTRKFEAKKAEEPAETEIAATTHSDMAS